MMARGIHCRDEITQAEIVLVLKTYEQDFLSPAWTVKWRYCELRWLNLHVRTPFSLAEITCAGKAVGRE